jgi:hypothetical protein
VVLSVGRKIPTFCFTAETFESFNLFCFIFFATWHWGKISPTPYVVQLASAQTGLTTQPPGALVSTFQRGNFFV